MKMSDERRKILEMLSQGKITVEEAEKLLSAVGETGESVLPAQSKKVPKYLKVDVNSNNGDKVNVRVPLQLIKAGMKLKSLIPENAQIQITEKLGEKGIHIDLEKMKPEDLDELLVALQELNVDVDSQNGDKVRVYCE